MRPFFVPAATFENIQKRIPSLQLGNDVSGNGVLAAGLPADTVGVAALIDTGAVDGVLHAHAVVDDVGDDLIAAAGALDRLAVSGLVGSQILHGQNAP